MDLSLSQQIVWLLVLAAPVAVVSWTVTHEEIFREPRDFCERRCETARSVAARKFFYVFTCEYCFSHYVAAAWLAITRFHLLYGAGDWRGYFLAWMALVWVANMYMSVFGRLRLDIKRERVEIKSVEKEMAETGGRNKSKVQQPDKAA